MAKARAGARSAHAEVLAQAHEKRGEETIGDDVRREMRPWSARAAMCTPHGLLMVTSSGCLSVQYAMLLIFVASRVCVHHALPLPHSHLSSYSFILPHLSPIPSLLPLSKRSPSPALTSQRPCSLSTSAQKRSGCAWTHACKHLCPLRSRRPPRRLARRG